VREPLKYYTSYTLLQMEQANRSLLRNFCMRKYTGETTNSDWKNLSDFPAHKHGYLCTQHILFFGREFLSRAVGLIWNNLTLNWRKYIIISIIIHNWQHSINSLINHNFMSVSLDYFWKCWRGQIRSILSLF